MAVNLVGGMSRSIENHLQNLTAVSQKEDKKESFFIPSHAKKDNAPYSHLAKDGVINYNGVQFVCDYDKNRLCLGNVDNLDDCIVVPLSDGGSLVVNRKNLGDLSRAAGMFSPEDLRRILCAISTDKRAQSVLLEIEEDKNSIGDGHIMGGQARKDELLKNV